MCYRIHFNGQVGFRPFALLSGCMQVCESVFAADATLGMGQLDGPLFPTGARKGAGSAVWGGAAFGRRRPYAGVATGPRS